MIPRVALLVLLVPACGGDGEPLPSWESECAVGFEETATGCRRVADVDLTCDVVECIAPDEIHEEDTGGTYRSLTCVWRCATLGGFIAKRVSLSFESTTDEPCWRMVHTGVEDGSCR